MKTETRLRIVRHPARCGATIMFLFVVLVFGCAVDQSPAAPSETIECEEDADCITLDGLCVGGECMPSSESGGAGDVLPFDTIIGTIFDEPIRSNGNSDLTACDYANISRGSTFAGFKNQCVEFSYRVLCRISKDLGCYGVPKDTYGDARQWWTNSAGNEVLSKLDRFASGTTTERPHLGDVLVWTSGAAGHVAIIRDVGEDYVIVAEQNRSCTSLDAARTITMTKSASGVYTIPGTAGWMRAPNVELEANCPGSDSWAVVRRDGTAPLWAVQGDRAHRIWAIETYIALGSPTINNITSEEFAACFVEGRPLDGEGALHKIPSEPGIYMLSADGYFHPFSSMPQYALCSGVGSTDTSEVFDFSSETIMSAIAEIDLDNFCDPGSVRDCYTYPPTFDECNADCLWAGECSEYGGGDADGDTDVDSDTDGDTDTDADADTDDDPCAGVICMMPPSNVCTGDKTLRTYDAVGDCTDGDCNYNYAAVNCDFGCVAASGDDYCADDPCVGITCSTPPNDVCTSENTIRVYATTGYCTDGDCDYGHTDISCPGGCTSATGDDTCSPSSSDTDTGDSIPCDGPADCPTDGVWGCSVDAHVCVELPIGLPGRCTACWDAPPTTASTTPTCHSLTTSTCSTWSPPIWWNTTTTPACGSYPAGCADAFPTVVQCCEAECGSSPPVCVTGEAAYILP